MDEAKINLCQNDGKEKKTCTKPYRHQTETDSAEKHLDI